MKIDRLISTIDPHPTDENVLILVDGTPYVPGDCY
jgi:hypothetical protein